MKGIYKAKKLTALTWRIVNQTVTSASLFFFLEQLSIRELECRVPLLLPPLVIVGFSAPCHKKITSGELCVRDCQRKRHYTPLSESKVCVGPAPRGGLMDGD